MTGQELQEARRRLGLTQAQLGNIMGMPQQAVAKLENGDRRITNIHAAFVRHLLATSPSACEGEGMSERKAQRLIQLARLRRNVDDGLAVYFWQGYIEGVRRALHGEAFNSERHDLLIAVTDQEFDDARRMQAKGYRAGLAGLEPEQNLPDV